jgi:hypothetical protein
MVDSITRMQEVFTLGKCYTYTLLQVELLPQGLATSKHSDEKESSDGGNKKLRQLSQCPSPDNLEERLPDCLPKPLPTVQPPDPRSKPPTISLCQVGYPRHPVVLTET